MRLDRLTSLRFFAAFAVLVCHLSLLTFKPRLEEVAIRGATGVTFFFMLSGFVLTWSHQPGDRAGGFWRRRFARVYPLHFVTWAIALIFLDLIINHPQSGRGSLLSLFLLQAWSPHDYFAANPVSWSLSAEATFYLCFPLLHRLLSRLTARSQLAVAVLAFAVVAGLCAGSDALAPHDRPWLAYNMPLSGLGEFVIGMLVALRVQAGMRLRLRPAAPIVAMVIGVAVAYVVPDPWWRTVPMIVPFALVICFAVQRDLEGLPGLLTDVRLIRLGVWSFALYLCHPLVEYVLAAIHPHYTFAQSIPIACAVGIVAIGLSGVLHEFVERPMERRLRGSRPRIELAPVEPDIALATAEPAPQLAPDAS